MINRRLLLELFDQNEAFVVRVLQVFKDQTPLQMDALRTAIEHGDTENASILAHNIKSQCHYLGLTEAASLCQSLENAPGAMETPARLAALDTIIAIVLEEIV
jgi:HPt (histidine-containing phosphotransfer) domain-containing protein